MATEIKFRDDYETCFDGRDYIAKYRTDLDVWENKRVIKSLNDFYEQLHLPEDACIMDLGCGPTLFAAAVACLHVRNIDVADYSAANRREVADWLKKDSSALDHSKVHEFVASLKNVKLTDFDAKLRSNVANVLHCDVLNLENSEFNKGHYDVITCMFCLFCACQNIEQYRQACASIRALLKPGGVLYVHEAYGESKYQVGDQWFHSLNMSKETIVSAYEDAGYSNVELKMKLHDREECDADLSDGVGKYIVVAVN